MKKFTTNWLISQFSKFKASTSCSFERWVLMDLHRISSLNYLADCVSKLMSASGQSAAVSIESIWIDGTPQAIGQTPSGKVNCELADLLIIVNECSLNGATVKQQGLLLQGKVTRKSNQIRNDGSTKKERLLLEDLDRTKDLEIYRDTQCSSLLRTYNFGAGTGLKEFARYLLIPLKIDKFGAACWAAPLQVGWPLSRTSKKIVPPIGFVQAIQEIWLGRVGTLIDPGNAGCTWTKLALDLLGSYKGMVMKGYGQQRRVNTSKNICCLVSREHFTFQASSSVCNKLPPENNVEGELELDIPPAISIIWVNIRRDAP